MSARDAQKTVVGQTARGMICPLQAEPSRPLHLATTYEVFAWKNAAKAMHCSISGRRTNCLDNHDSVYDSSVL